MLKSIIVFRFIIILLIGVCPWYISAQKFIKKDVLSDLEYLKSSLEDTHFNLYAYVTKDEFEEKIKELKEQIKSDSLSQKEVAIIFQKLVAITKNAHTRIDEPDQYQAYINYFNSGGSVFPLEIAIEDKMVLIRKNWSTNTTIEIGAEIKTINGIPINEILEQIYPLISAERSYFLNSQLEAFTFPRYYWQVFGEQKEFDIGIVQNGKRLTLKLSAIRALEDYEMKREDILKYGWELKYPLNSVAYLRPGPFGGDLEKYKLFIDSSFADIKINKSKNLIIDLRNHPGGDDPFGDYLVSYIADKPFKWAQFQLKSSALLKEHISKHMDTTSAYARSILTHKNGEVYNYDFDFHDPQPEDQRFNDKVYVLVNRMSYSQSTVTAAQMQDYGWGEIVGEETAEFPNLYASIFTYQLPKTGIKVDVSKGRIERLSGNDNGRGVIPDIIIKDHLLDEKDEILEALLTQLSEK